MSIIAVLDLETTGDSPEDVPVEIGIVYLHNGSFSSQYHTLINPGKRSIHPCAQASHHITLDDLRKNGLRVKPAFYKKLVEDCDYIVAHYAAFDKGFLPDLSKPWICTHRCAQHLWPESPKHKLQVLRYYLGLAPQIPSGLHPHRALYDAHVCAALLQRMLEQHTPDELHTMMEQPLVFHQVGFGKHKGEPWADLPMDYLHWILRQDFDEDTKNTARHHIAETRRRQSSVSEVSSEHACS